MRVPIDDAYNRWRFAFFWRPSHYAFDSACELEYEACTPEQLGCVYVLEERMDIPEPLLVLLPRPH